MGAPFGGTTRGGHHGVDSEAFSLITPPNGIGGGGSCFPSMVVVALGEPGTPLISCAITGMAARSAMALDVSESRSDRLFFLPGSPRDFAIGKVASESTPAVELLVLGSNGMTGSSGFSRCLHDYASTTLSRLGLARRRFLRTRFAPRTPSLPSAG